MNPSLLSSISKLFFKSLSLPSPSPPIPNPSLSSSSTSSAAPVLTSLSPRWRGVSASTPAGGSSSSPTPSSPIAMAPPSISSPTQAADLLQKLSLEPKTKAHDAPEVTKKHAALNGGNKQNVAIPPVDRSGTPVLQNMDANMWYFHNGYATPYLYGGYVPMSDWEDYSRYDGVEMPPPGCKPSPEIIVNHSGWEKKYPAPYFQPPSHAPYTPNQAPTSKGEVVSTSAAADQPPISLDAAKVNTNGVANWTVNGNNGSVPQKPSQQNSPLTSNNSYGQGLRYQDFVSIFKYESIDVLKMNIYFSFENF